MTPAASKPLVAVTCGEPAGIGPDLCVLLAGMDIPADIAVIGDRSLLESRAEMLGRRFDAPDYVAGARQPFSLLDMKLGSESAPGIPDPSHAKAILEGISRAVSGCLDSEFHALVTAPVHKGAINAAGIPFTGHTEYLAELTATPRVVMMLAGGGMRVALATTHLPLRDVPDAIGFDSLAETLRILDRDLRIRFGIASPKIAVAGLNPHAGESGYLGREEIEVISPAIEATRAEGIDASGPFPADTLFGAVNIATYDAFLAMYHDQGLPVLKHASFGEGVNITLGLPIVRTSVDHGTALDLAGTGKISAGSLAAAIRCAVEMRR